MLNIVLMLVRTFRLADFRTSRLTDFSLNFNILPSIVFVSLRMTRLLLLVTFICAALVSSAQYDPSCLFIKKGAKKKRTYTEGERISLLGKNDTVYNGLITLLLNDTIYLNGFPIPSKSVKAVLIPRKKNRFPADLKTIGLLTAGSAMVAGGLMLNGQEKRDEALITGFAMGYGSLLSSYLIKTVAHTFKRKQYRFGKKYRLQVIDFHLPNRRGF